MFHSKKKGLINLAEIQHITYSKKEARDFFDILDATNTSFTMKREVGSDQREGTTHKSVFTFDSRAITDGIKYGRIKVV